MKKNFILIFALLLAVFVANSQRNVTTISGQRIIIMPDGSWIPSNDHFEADASSSGEITFQAYLSSIMKSNVLEMIQAAENKEINTFLDLVNLQKESDRNKLQISLAKKQNNKEKVKLLEQETIEIENKYKIANEQYKQYALYVAKAKNLRFVTEKDFLPQIKELSELLHVKLKEESPSENNLPGTRTINGQQKIQIKVNDIDLTCHVKNNNVISGIKTIEMVPQPLFKYTPVKLKNYFKEKELIVASVSILSENKSKKLRISLKLISKDASKNYGYIPIDGLLRILFISGKKIDLYGLRNARGETELYTGNIVYTADYSLSDDDANALSDIPLDNIGMMWSSGFETYTIYNVDVIMNQLSCLKKLLN